MVYWLLKFSGFSWKDPGNDYILHVAMLSKLVSTLFQVLLQLFLNKHDLDIIILNQERVGL